MMIIKQLWAIFCAFVLNIEAIGPGFAQFTSKQYVNSAHQYEDNNNIEQQQWSYKPSGEDSYSFWNCHEIPPNMTLCKGVGYSQMVLPNFLRHESIREVIQQANVWVALVNTDCHPDIQRFLCSLYAPVCLKSHQEAKIPPCWELCDQVRNACLPRMRLFGFDWPDIVQCSKFPKLAESMCISPQENTAVVKCAPCEQALTLENIASSYCMADVVLKASLKGVVLDSTNSLLRLAPNSRTKALKLLRKDGTTSTSSEFNRLRRQTRLQRLHYRNLRSRYYRHVPTGQTRPTDPRDLLINRLPYLENWHIRARRSLPHWAQTFNQSMDNSGQRQTGLTQPKNNKSRKRRKPRNSKLHDLDGINELHLSCSACSGLPTTHDIVSKMQNQHWLIMGRRIVDEKTGNLSNIVQVTFLTKFDKESPEFKRSVTAIRTQPVSNLCPKKQSVIASPIPNSAGSLTPNRNLKILRSVHSELSDAPTSNGVTQVPFEPHKLSGYSDDHINIRQSVTPSTLYLNPNHLGTSAGRYPRPPTQPYQNVYYNQPVQSYKRWNRGNPSQSNILHQSQTNWLKTVQARRRKRRRERRLWQQRQQQQQQQQPIENQQTPLTDSSLRQKPINPYSDEPISQYPSDFMWL